MLTLLTAYGPLYLLSAFLAAWIAAYPLAESEPSPAAQLMISIGTATFLALWTIADARIRRRLPCYEFDSIVFFTWAISVPAYLIWTRGWWGLLIVSTLLAVFVAVAAFFIAAGTVVSIAAEASA